MLSFGSEVRQITRPVLPQKSWSTTESCKINVQSMLYNSKLGNILNEILDLSFHERWLPSAFCNSRRLNIPEKSQCSGGPRFIQNNFNLCWSSCLSSKLICKIHYDISTQKKKTQNMNFACKDKINGIIIKHHKAYLR